jgi:hypothetical protein
MTYAAPIELVQAALSRIGSVALTSLEDDSMEARVANLNYEGIARKRLSMGPWSFASLPVTLVRVGERNVGRMRFAYQIPPESIHVLWVGMGDTRAERWSIDNGNILLDQDLAWEAKIATRAPESDWSPSFAEAFIVELEALCIGSLQRQPQESQMRAREAERMFRAALTADERQQTGVSHLRPGALAQAWRGYRTRTR